MGGKGELHWGLRGGIYEGKNWALDQRKVLQVKEQHMNFTSPNVWEPWLL